VRIRKKNRDLWFSVDYWLLNGIAKKDFFLLPRIDDTLDKLARAKWFFILGLKSNCLQVAHHSSGTEKTVFSTRQCCGS
jgi:hypothetical protein